MGRKAFSLFLGLLALLSLVFAGTADAAGPVNSDMRIIDSGHRSVGEIEVNGRVVLRIRHGYGGLTVEERTRIVFGRLQSLLKKGFCPLDVRPEFTEEGLAVVMVGDQPLVTVDEYDSLLNRTQPATLAGVWADNLRASLETEAFPGRLEPRMKLEVQKGLASWYGPGFHGRGTANGETFDQNALTAAHRTLPFGAKVLVINPEKGTWVVVRINDRGPWVDDRIIDLSRAAFLRLGLLKEGVIPVELVALY